MQNSNLTEGKKSRTRAAFWIAVTIIVAATLGYFASDGWPHEEDSVADSARHSTNVIELRQALNALRANGSPGLYHQAVSEAPNTPDYGIVYFLVYMPDEWRGQKTDISQFTADQFAVQLTPVLAICKASTWDWRSVNYDFQVTQNHRSATVFHADYSRRTLSRINLSKKKGRALFEAADSHNLDPQYHWAGNNAG